MVLSAGSDEQSPSCSIQCICLQCHQNVTTAGDKRAMNRCELQWLFLSFLKYLIDVLRLQPLTILLTVKCYKEFYCYARSVLIRSVVLRTKFMLFIYSCIFCRCTFFTYLFKMCIYIYLINNLSV